MGLGLFIVISLTCLGLVIWHEATDGETVGALSALLSVLERMAAVLVTLSLTIYASVEGAAMLYEKYAKRRFREGKQVGVLEGRETERIERDREWASWLERRDEALASGKPFDEPPPSSKPSPNGE